MNTANSPLTHMLLKTQWAIMRELKRVVLKFYVLFISSWSFITNNYSKEIRCQRKVTVK